PTTSIPDIFPTRRSSELSHANGSQQDDQGTCNDRPGTDCQTECLPQTVVEDIPGTKPQKTPFDCKGDAQGKNDQTNHIKKPSLCKILFQLDTILIYHISNSLRF